MEKPWRRSLAALTRDVDPSIIVPRAFALALLATVLALPYFHFLLHRVAGHIAARPAADPDDLLVTQSTLLFTICFLSAMVGFGFSRRYGLPGIGRFDEWRRSLPLLLATGLGLSLLSWYLGGQDLRRLSPVPRPDGGLCRLAIPLYGSLTEELILRFGFVTLAVGLCRNRPGGVILAAIFAAILTEKYFVFVGLPPGWDAPSVVRFLASVLIHSVLGSLYVTRGLWCSMTVKLVMELPFFLLSPPG